MIKEYDNWYHGQLLMIPNAVFEGQGRVEVE
jgi:hypothetical protein